MAALLGIDLGTSAVKAVVLDEGGQVLGTGTREIPMEVAARAFAMERRGVVGTRARNLADYLEAGTPLSLALKRSGNTLPSEAMLAADMGASWSSDEAPSRLRRLLTPADLDLTLDTLPGGQVELRSGRVFLDGAVSASAATADPTATGVLTYFVNSIDTGGGTATPYSMVSAIGPVNDDGAHRG